MKIVKLEIIQKKIIIGFILLSSSNVFASIDCDIGVNLTMFSTGCYFVNKNEQGLDSPSNCYKFLSPAIKKIKELEEIGYCNKISYKRSCGVSKYITHDGRSRYRTAIIKGSNVQWLDIGGFKDFSLALEEIESLAAKGFCNTVIEVESSGPTKIEKRVVEDTHINNSSRNDNNKFQWYNPFTWKHYSSSSKGNQQ